MLDMFLRWWQLLCADPHRWAPVWNLVVTILQLLLTLLFAIFLGVQF